MTAESTVRRLAAVLRPGAELTTQRAPEGRLAAGIVKTARALAAKATKAQPVLRGVR
jgi:hypothetical protein